MTLWTEHHGFNAEGDRFHCKSSVTMRASCSTGLPEAGGGDPTVADGTLDPHFGG